MADNAFFTIPDTGAMVPLGSTAHNDYLTKMGEAPYTGSRLTNPFAGLTDNGGLLYDNPNKGWFDTMDDTKFGANGLAAGETSYGSYVNGKWEPDIQHGPSQTQGMAGLDYAQVGLGVGQLGLGLAGYLDNKKTAKAQRGLLKQQLSDAKNERETRDKVRGSLSAGFGG